MPGKLSHPLTQALVICALAALTGFAYNAVSDNGLPWLYRPPAFSDQQEITSETAYRLLRSGRALFIDSRPDIEYEYRHIPGAVNLPIDAPRDSILSFSRQYPRDQLLVIYCESSDCRYSIRMAGMLSFVGFERVLIFRGGLAAWEAQNFPVESDDAAGGQ